MKTNAKEMKRQMRIRRTRAKITGTAERPRLTVRRSLKHIYAQIIDDTKGATIVAVSDANLSEAEMKEKTRTEVAFIVGKKIAEVGKEKGVESVVFDRRDRRYHGRIKALADGAREGGLTF
ncbi:MAG: 50S ribosomal protein L18 [bacterium]|nr:50S ribosomal protein L18 [bacterium]